MQFSTLALSFVVAVAAASPIEKRQFGLCSSALDSALCCDASVGGVLNLNCGPPSSSPTDVSDFIAICAEGGQSAACCTLPLLGDALLCQAV